MISNPKEVLQKSIQVGKKKGEKEDELMFKEYDKFFIIKNVSSMNILCYFVFIASSNHIALLDFCKHYD